MYAIAPLKDVMWWLPRFVAPAAAVLIPTFFLPASFFDLKGGVAVSAYWVAESGGKYGLSLLAVMLTALVVLRPGVAGKARLVETWVIATVLAAVLGGGAWLNEHVVKPAFAVPRPNVIELAAVKEGESALLMSLEEFYALPDKEQRSEHLEKILAQHEELHDRIRAHWIAETGYSFPSGHSFAAMLFATFFLALARTYFVGTKRRIFCLLILWAVAVCLSRAVLRVHSATDICVGGLEGVLGGILAFWLVHWALSLLLHRPSLAAAESLRQEEKEH